MKIKGITIWERHAEKFVVALAVVAACAFAALQFIGTPNAVSTSAGTYGPGQINKELEQRAEDLMANLDDTAPPALQIADPVGATDNLMRRLDGSISPAPTLAPFDVALAPSVEGMTIGENVTFIVPEVKAPAEVAVGQYTDALAEGVVEDFPELAALFSDPGQPHDLTFATAAATFDLASLRSQLRGEGRAGGDDQPQPIPVSWYADRAENIVDIVIEREELVDGQWTNATVLDPIPGQYSYRSRYSGDELQAALRDEVLSALADPVIQNDIVRPEFYELKNEDWSIPMYGAPPVHEGVDGADANSVQAQVRRLKQRRLEYRQEIARLEHDLEQLGGSSGDAGGNRPRGGGSGSGAGGVGGGGEDNPLGRRKKKDQRDAPGKGRGGFGIGGTDKSSGPSDKDRIKKLQAKLANFRLKLSRVEQQLKELGSGDLAEEVVEIDDTPLMERDELVVWGHDLHVQPGHTYRYRLAVRIYNPFFGRKRNLVESQQALADKFTISSTPSEWSEPIRVNSMRRVFVTQATPPGGTVIGALSLGRVTAEVYRFYDGVQWMETFNVTPGGYIGGLRTEQHDGGPVEIDFTTDLFVLDIVEGVDAGTAVGARGAALPQGDGTQVLLQDFRTGEVLQLRNPAAETASFERRELRDRVEAQVAQAGAA